MVSLLYHVSYRHPDKNPGCNECKDKFQKIAEAYEFLADEAKRAGYDTVKKMDIISRIEVRHIQHNQVGCDNTNLREF